MAKFTVFHVMAAVGPVDFSLRRVISEKTTFSSVAQAFVTQGRIQMDSKA